MEAYLQRRIDTTVLLDCANTVGVVSVNIG